MRPLLSALTVILAAGVGRADPVDNPEFKSWSAFKPGTAVKMKTVSEAMNVKSEVLITTKLVEVAADKLVLEVETAVTANGMEFKQPATKRDVPKTVDVPKVEGQPAKPAEKPEGTSEEGKETLKIGGTDVKAKWFKYKSKAAGTEVEGQTWMSDDVPGGVVKSVVTIAGMTAGKTTMEIIEFKKP